jgi:hypothetical protein
MRNASSFRPGWRDQSPQVEEHAQGQKLAWVVRGGPFTQAVLAQSFVTLGMSRPDRTIIMRVRVELPVAIPGAGDHMEDVLAMVPCAVCGEGLATLQRDDAGHYYRSCEACGSDYAGAGELALQRGHFVDADKMVAAVAEDSSATRPGTSA